MDKNEHNPRTGNIRIPTLGLRHGLLALAIGTGIVLDSCLPSREYSEPKTAQGIVEAKTHTSESIFLLPVDDILVPLTSAESYRIDVRSPGCSGSVDDKVLYETFSRGDHIDVKYRDVREYRAIPSRMSRHMVVTGCQILGLSRSTTQ